MPVQSTNVVAVQINKTVSSTALTLINLGFTKAQIDAADQALITVNSTTSVNFTYDGSTAPTTTAGHFLATNTNFLLIGKSKLQGLQLIRSGAVDSTVSITLEAY